MDIFGSRGILTYRISHFMKFAPALLSDPSVGTLYAKRAYISEHGSESVANGQLLFVVTQTKSSNQCRTVSVHPFQLINSSFLRGRNHDLAFQRFLGISFGEYLKSLT